MHISDLNPQVCQILGDLDTDTSSYQTTSVLHLWLEFLATLTPLPRSYLTYFRPKQLAKKKPVLLVRLFPQCQFRAK